MKTEINKWQVNERIKTNKPLSTLLIIKKSPVLGNGGAITRPYRH